MTTHQIFCCVFVFFVALASSCETAFAKETTSGNHIERLRIAGDAYRANIDSFPYMVAKCIMTMRYARSFEDAMAREYVDGEPITAEGYYAYDDSVARTDVIYPSHLHEKFRRNIGPGQKKISFLSTQLLFDGFRMVRFFPDMRSASIDRAETSPANPMIHPFNFGLTGPKGDKTFDRFLEQFLREGSPKCFLMPSDQVDGVDCWVIKVVESNPEVIRLYWLDPARGFMPLRHEIAYDGRTKCVLRVLDCEGCSPGNRWLPKHAVLAIHSRESDFLLVREIEYTSFQVDAAPSKEALSLNIPEGIRVTDGIGGFSWRTGDARLPSPRLVDLRLYKSEDYKQVVEDPAFPSSAERPNRLRTWFVLFNLVIIVAIIILIVKKRKYAH